MFLGSLPGGWIADRLMGAQRAVWIGGIIIMCGHFILAVPSESLFFAGLIVIVLGTGLLKPNITAIVGELYQLDDPRRDSGVHDLLHGDQSGRHAGPARLRVAGAAQLALRLRGGGRRHAVRP